MKRSLLVLLAVALVCASLPVVFAAVLGVAAQPAGATTTMIPSSVPHSCPPSGDQTAAVRQFLGDGATVPGNTYQLQPNGCYVVQQIIGLHAGVTVDFNGATIKRTQVQPEGNNPGAKSIFKLLSGADNVTITSSANGKGTILVRDGIYTVAQICTEAIAPACAAAGLR